MFPPPKSAKLLTTLIAQIFGARLRVQKRQSATAYTIGKTGSYELIMARTNSLLEYQSFVCEWLRSMEIQRAQGNTERLRELESQSDLDLLKKWLWIGTIAGFPIFYLVVPFVLSLLKLFLWVWIMQFLWLLAKGAMGIVFIVFMLAVYFTLRKTAE